MELHQYLQVQRTKIASTELKPPAKQLYTHQSTQSTEVTSNNNNNNNNRNNSNNNNNNNNTAIDEEVTTEYKQCAIATCNRTAYVKCENNGCDMKLCGQHHCRVAHLTMCLVAIFDTSPGVVYVDLDGSIIRTRG